MTSKYSSSSIRNDQIALHIKPQKQMKKVFLYRQYQDGKQALKRGPRRQSQSSSLFLDSQQPGRFLSHLKQLKSVKHLTLGFTYPFEVPQHFILKILNSLKSLKGLTVVHLEIVCLSLPIHSLDFNSFCQALLLINDLPRVQMKFSLNFLASLPGIFPLQQSPLFGNLTKLERLTSVSLTFSNFIALSDSLFAIDPLKKSKSLTKFSLTLQDDPVGDPPQVRDLLIFLKEIKSLKSTEILFQKHNLPPYKKLKELIPLLEEAGQRGAIKMTFEKCAQNMGEYQSLKFLKSAQKIKSRHKVEVKITPLKSLYCRAVEYGIAMFFLIFGVPFMIFIIVDKATSG